MKILTQISQEPEPKGKRRWKNNIYGNTVGYIGSRRWKEFGPTCDWAEREAQAWCNGEEYNGE